jgi:hypothetical protein
LGNGSGRSETLVHVARDSRKAVELDTLCLCDASVRHMRSPGARTLKGAL